MQVWEALITEAQTEERNKFHASKQKLSPLRPGAERLALTSTCFPTLSQSCTAEYADWGDELQSPGNRAISFTN